MATESPPSPIPDDVNPYAPPATALEPEPVELIPTTGLSEAEAIRKKYIGHEASIKSIGLLHYFGAFVGILVGVCAAVVGVASNLPGGSMPRAIVIGGSIVYLAMGGLHLVLGIGIRRLQSWARWTDVVLTALVLAAYVLGTIGNLMLKGVETPLIGLLIGSSILGYILYLLLSSKASTIFSAEYKTIITQTPHIRRRTSLVVKLFLGLIVAIAVLSIIGAILGRMP